MYTSLDVMIGAYMDKSRALERFSSYVANYDPNNPRIALKIAHTYRVAELCERIAPSIASAN